MSKDKTAPEPDQPLTTAPAPTTSGSGAVAPAPTVDGPKTDAPVKSSPPAKDTQATKSKTQVKAEKKAADPLRGSRSSGFYASVVALAVVLVLLIIFILQNTQTATVNFLGWTGQAPASVVLLIAAAAGLFLALVASSLRIFQLRRRVKRDRKAA